MKPDTPESPLRGHARKPTKLVPSAELLRKLNLNAAGIDVGSASHFVAVPADRDPKPVREFRSFTADLHRLADWLVACRVDTVAMESTGIYWIPLFEILKDRGLEVLLVNARHLKNVPGRKSDVLDCQWLQELHTYGLLRGSFRPEPPIAALRTYLRHREVLVEYAASHTQQIQKALTLMNLQLTNVLSDVVGVTGMAILRDILAGERDPKVLARHRDARCKATEAEIVASLTGNYRPEHFFTLRQTVELYDVYHEKIAACDRQLEALLATLAKEEPKTPASSLPPARTRKKPRNNEPSFEIRSPLYALAGADITQIEGIGPYTALRVLGEIGTDMSPWKSAKHFTSWLTLAPRNRISGEKLLSSKTPPSANRLAKLFRQAAVSVGRTQTALGAFYRRLAARIGKAKALTATARKIAAAVYAVLSRGRLHLDPGADAYNLRYRARTLATIRRRAKDFGFQLVPATQTPPPAGEVS